MDHAPRSANAAVPCAAYRTLLTDATPFDSRGVRAARSLICRALTDLPCLASSLRGLSQVATKGGTDSCAAHDHFSPSLLPGMRTSRMGAVRSPPTI